MAEDGSLVAVVAHGLLKSMTSVHGLLSTARSLVEQDTLDRDRLDYLMTEAEAKALEVTQVLRLLASGAPPGEVVNPGARSRVLRPG